MDALRIPDMALALALCLYMNVIQLRVDMMLAQPKDENTLMLHKAVVAAFRFSMKYLKSSYANHDWSMVAEGTV